MRQQAARMILGMMAVAVLITAISGTLLPLVIMILGSQVRPTIDYRARFEAPIGRSWPFMVKWTLRGLSQNGS